MKDAWWLSEEGSNRFWCSEHCSGSKSFKGSENSGGGKGYWIDNQISLRILSGICGTPSKELVRLLAFWKACTLFYTHMKGQLARFVWYHVMFFIYNIMYIWWLLVTWKHDSTNQSRCRSTWYWWSLSW